MRMNIGPTFSRRHLAAGFAAILAFPIVPALAWEKRFAGEPTAKKFLGSIYQRYVGKSSAVAAGIPLTNAQLVRSYFTAGLASLIWTIALKRPSGGSRRCSTAIRLSAARNGTFQIFLLM